LIPTSINQILKSIQKQASLNQISKLSDNSYRVSDAIDLLNKSIPLEKNYAQRLLEVRSKSDEISIQLE
jgi:hypothetical protein